MTTKPEPVSVPDEINAMRRIANTLDRLDPATRARVARWICDRWLPDEAEEQQA